MNSRVFRFLSLVVIICCIGVLAILVTSTGAVPSQPAVNISSPFEIIRPPSDVQALVLDEPDLLWAGGKDGITLMNRSNRSALTTPACMSGITYVRALLFDDEKSLWIGTDTGLYRYHDGTCDFFSTDNGLPDNTVFCLLSDRAGTVHACTMKGAVMFSKGKISGYQTGMQNPIVFTMGEDEHGGLWYGSYASSGGGVSILKNGSWQFFGVKDGLPHKAITSMLSARDGSFWIGSGVYDHGGAVRFTWNGTGWNIAQVFTKDSGLAGEKVRSLFQDDSGAIWLGSEMDGIARYANGTFHVYTVQDGISDQEVLDMVQETNGDLWLGTKNGITRIPAGIIPP